MRRSQYPGKTMLCVLFKQLSATVKHSSQACAMILGFDLYFPKRIHWQFQIEVEMDLKRDKCVVSLFTPRRMVDKRPFICNTGCLGKIDHTFDQHYKWMGNDAIVGNPNSASLRLPPARYRQEGGRRENATF